MTENDLSGAADAGSDVGAGMSEDNGFLGAADGGGGLVGADLAVQMGPPIFNLVLPRGLRFRRRHVLKTIANYLRQNMVARGWGIRGVNDPLAPDPGLNFGGSPWCYIETLPEFVPTSVGFNTVAVTLGNEDENIPEEMGGSLYSVSYPLTVDVYGETASGSVSMSADLKAVMCDVVIPVYDFTGVPSQVPGEYVEFEHVMGPSRPTEATISQDFRRHWRQVQVEAVAYFSNSEMG
jgi:hypothetical protein